MPTSTSVATTTPGGNACHCGGCGETFTGITAFDAHRVNRRHGDAMCADPADVGLILRTRPTGTIWGFPGDNTTFDAA